MNYGIPYQGSKAKICADVCGVFPVADNFYDLFGGGFSITHYMLLHRHGHYKRFHFNDIRPGLTNLIRDSIAGKYSYKNYLPPWVSREDFHRLVDKDPLVKILWSFGNNGKYYLFGEDIEPHKRSMHMAVVFNEFDSYAKSWLGMERFADGYSILDRRLYVRDRGKLNAVRGDLERLEQLERLERLQQLEQLERLERLQQLELYSGSYLDVPIKPNSVIYCDIPYEGTVGYDNNSSFDRKVFLDWADAQAEPVYISEYEINDPRFTCLGSVQKRSLMSANKTIVKKPERVYVNAAGARRSTKF